MRKIKIAQIGINRYSHAIEVANSLLRQPEIFEFVGIVFPENEKETMPHKYEQVKDLPELTLEQVLSDALFLLAGELSLKSMLDTRT